MFKRELRYASRSSKWPALRREHMKKQPCCQACGSDRKPEVHHIVPVHLDPSRELDPSNLITLCDKWCHFVFGHLLDYRSWNKDVVTDARHYLEKRRIRPYKSKEGNDYEAFNWFNATVFDSTVNDPDDNYGGY